MALRTAAEFIEVLQRSRLLDREQGEKVRRLGRDFSDATALAKELARREILTRWQAGALLAGRTLFFLGNHKLIELLGRGGMGAVFLGEHTIMKRRVALKVIPRAFSQDPAALERFFAEVRTIAALDHPNIVQAFNVDVSESGRYYLVMEYVEGMDLQRLVEAEGPLAPEEAVFYIRQAAEGLEHAHSRNLVHCDIKPSNLIVSPQGVVKILDLGLARLSGPESQNDQPDSSGDRILGSVDYQAPEQALGSPDFDRRADVYSLGCTLYFLLTGEPPYPEGTLHERILKHQTAEPPDASRRREDVPASLAAICQKAMAKKPQQRYATAAEFGQTLAAWRPEVALVKRTLPLKKTQPVEELAKDQFIGFDLSDLLPARNVEEKLPEAVLQKRDSSALNEWFQPLIGTRPRVILTASVAAMLGAVLLFLLVLLIVWGRNDTEPPIEQRPDDSTSTEGGPPAPLPPAIVSEPEAPSPLPPPPASADQDQVSTIPPAPETPKPEPKPKPKSKKKPKKKPEPPPPPQESSPPLPAVQPLKDLTLLADLPSPPRGEAPAGDEVILAHVPLKPEWSLHVAVEDEGGAPPDAKRWKLRWNDHGEEVEWIISLEAGGGESRPTDVARLVHRGNDLFFSWINGAGGRASALRNCALDLSVWIRGEKKQVGETVYLPLRRSRHAPPLTVNLDRGITQIKLKGKSLPNASKLKLEILQPLEAPFPPGEVKAVEGEGALRAEIQLKEKKYQNFALGVGLEEERRELVVGLASYLHIEEQRSKPLQLRDMERLVTFNERKWKAMQNQLSPEQNRQMSETLQHYQEILNLLKALNNQATLQYRVYLPLEHYQLELFSTKIPPAEK
ncbi:MAG: serine/threonine protein kinase [Pirellulales bacterium]|nr:serine/threonine protein kinase [Pirellulales bacterium]